MKRQDEIIQLEKDNFVFSELGEFGDPYYVYLLNGKPYGFIEYKHGEWRGKLIDQYVYSSGIFITMAEKIEELNEELEARRNKVFWL